jgi:prepilin-type processing-associated H-X9-DG protein
MVINNVWDPRNRVDTNVLFHLLPFIGQENLQRLALDSDGVYRPCRPVQGQPPVCYQTVKLYQCPSDPTFDSSGKFQPGDWALGCYGANFQVFGYPWAGDNVNVNMQGSPQIPGTFSDGTSQTILFAEKYSICSRTYPTLWAVACFTVTSMPLFAYGSPDGCDFTDMGASYGGPGVAGPASKFQHRPTQAVCDPNMAQGPHTGGINVCMADGHVLLLSPGIDGGTWWALCTPSGGEVVSGDF